MKNVFDKNVALAQKALAHLDMSHEERFMDGKTSAFDPFLNSFADNVVYRVPCMAGTPKYDRDFHGREEIIDLFMSDSEIYDSIEVEGPPEYVGCGDIVLVLFALRYTIRHTGVTYRNNKIALVMRFDDNGKIVEMDEYQDMSAWNLACAQIKTTAE